MILSSFLRFLFLIWPAVMAVFLLIFSLRWRRGSRSLSGLFAGAFLIWLAWVWMALLLLVWGNLPPEIHHRGWFALLFWGWGGLSSGGLLLSRLFPLFRDLRRLKRARDLDALYQISPQEFEDLVAAYFRRQGFYVQSVGSQGDHGIDLVLHKPREGKTIVQCKRYRGAVGEPLVRDLYGTMIHEGAVGGYLMTTGKFTRQALRWAEDKPIHLIEGEELVERIRQQS